MLHPNTRIARLAFGLLLFSHTLLAQDTPEEDIIITADTAQFHQEEGWGIYRGNAELEQGQRHMEADYIKLYVDKEGELKRVEAEGKPAKLRDGEEIHAQAEFMRYDVKNDTITLTKNAYINNDGRTFEGATVVYHLSTRSVEADGGETGERVRLVIPADKKGDK